MPLTLGAILSILHKTETKQSQGIYIVPAKMIMFLQRNIILCNLKNTNKFLYDIKLSRENIFS